MTPPPQQWPPPPQQWPPSAIKIHAEDRHNINVGLVYQSKNRKCKKIKIKISS